MADVMTSRGSFKSSDGVNDISYITWSGEDRPRAVIHIIHGMCEYAGRYDEIARFFVSKGFAVGGQDHLGHGHTAKSDDDLGYFAKKDGYRYLIEDAKLMGDILKTSFPGIPYIVYGHSMGSFIARLYFEKYGSDIDAIIISGTAGKNPAAGAVKLICGITKLFCGERAKSKITAGLMNKIALAKLKDARTPYDWISHDTAIVDKYAADKYSTFIFSASAYIDLMKLLSRCNRKKWFENIPKDKPALLISGTEDPIGNYGDGVRQVLIGMLDHGAQQTEINLIEGMRHEPHNETDRSEVYQYLSEWLDYTINNIDKQ